MNHAGPVETWLSKLPRWRSECAHLRAVLQSCRLAETIKWSKPCYTHAGKNIAIIQPMKAFVALMFFKGMQLDDPEELLEEQGPNTRAAKRVCLTSTQQIRRLAPAIRDLVSSAVAVEARHDPPLQAPELHLVEELAERLAGDRKLEAAFMALTPGRQRAYNIHVKQAKQSTTRKRRIEKVVPRILAGKGLRD